MSPETTPLGPWDTSTGMVDDIDAYMQNCRFGINDKYAAKVQEAIEDSSAPQDQLCFLADLVNAENEPISSLVYSIGKDWFTDDEGATVKHATRSNIVKNSRYGVFMDKVVKQLGVDMSQYGEDALHAASWEGLGFHWKTEKLATMKKDELKDVLMPATFLGKLEAGTQAAAQPAVAATPIAAPAVKPGAKTAAVKPAAVKAGVKVALVVDPALDAKLTMLAKNLDMKAFQENALKEKAVPANQPLLASILNESAEGYYHSHRAA